ncbi:hypothetical protein PFICI_08032 [Pestalotiopsis fici W106-1]|uniref:Golgi apparatus membrane protein TVP38 n=1 Tax=Pestalotiopsis fici (strain W106-1 / CGMCC3.15140) TaxID=1229662 RepID=W3X2Y0_PESFW|nr:uncharacterized protein PFICI_08032 [Pestalotiopsis fici W106-1]ETS80503.1 hypothetical protein PFICI_08032 [Pestalotiopsis fici W106-1]
MAKVDDVEMAKKKNEPTGPLSDADQPPTEYRPINWKKVFLTPKYIPWHILMIVIIVITALITIYHDKVVEILRPFSEKVRDVPAGWLIPIAILIVISFPPLFGHEIIGLLCGVVYGLWVGFAIVAAGTFLGEVGTWFAFKRALRKKAEKMERTNLNYAALARVTRDSGFWMVFIIRFSIVPSHFSTAVFSTCDVKFWHFCVATFLTLPKQIFIVYLGVLLVAQDENNKTQTIVLVITFAITVVMGYYIWVKMKKAKTILLQEQAARQTNYSMERLRQDQGASTAALTANAADGSGSGSGSGDESSERTSMMWENRSDARQDVPLGYAMRQSQDIGVAHGDPYAYPRYEGATPTPEMSRYDTGMSRPEISRYDTAEYPTGPYQQVEVRQAAPAYAMEQKPYYQRAARQESTPTQSSTDLPQVGREWV